MTSPGKLRGGVITSQDHKYGLVELIAFQLRHRVAFVYYSHPYQIETDLRHDFVIVLSLDDLAKVVRLYETKGLYPPLVVHIDTPSALRHARHVDLFPGVDVIPIPQADLSSEPDVTLDLHVLDKIMARLEARDSS